MVYPNRLSCLVYLSSPWLIQSNVVDVFVCYASHLLLLSRDMLYMKSVRDLSDPETATRSQYADRIYLFAVCRTVSRKDSMAGRRNNAVVYRQIVASVPYLCLQPSDLSSVGGAALELVLCRFSQFE